MFASLIAKKKITIISRARGFIKAREGASSTRLARWMILSLQWWLTVEFDQLMRISPTRTKQSKNSSSVPAVLMDPRGRRGNRSTMHSSESQVMEGAPSTSPSDITRKISVPTQLRTMPTRAALADIGTSRDDESGAC